jgi:hypothetical protein
MLLIIIIKKGYAMACLLLGSSEARSPVGFFWGPFVAWSDLVAAMIGKGAGKAVYKQGASLHRSVQSYNLTNPLYTDPYHFTVLKYQKGPFAPNGPKCPQIIDNPPVFTLQTLPNCKWFGGRGAIEIQGIGTHCTVAYGRAGETNFIFQQPITAKRCHSADLQ